MNLLLFVFLFLNSSFSVSSAASVVDVNSSKPDNCQDTESELHIIYADKFLEAAEEFLMLNRSTGKHDTIFKRLREGESLSDFIPPKLDSPKLKRRKHFAFEDGTDQLETQPVKHLFESEATIDTNESAVENNPSSVDLTQFKARIKRVPTESLSSSSDFEEIPSKSRISPATESTDTSSVVESTRQHNPPAYQHPPVYRYPPVYYPPVAHITPVAYVVPVPVYYQPIPMPMPMLVPMTRPAYCPPPRSIKPRVFRIYLGKASNFGAQLAHIDHLANFSDLEKSRKISFNKDASFVAIPSPCSSPGRVAGLCNRVPIISTTFPVSSIQSKLLTLNDILQDDRVFQEIIAIQFYFNDLYEVTVSILVRNVKKSFEFNQDFLKISLATFLA